MEREIRVFLIDDNGFLLESLEFLINNQPGFRVIGKSTKGRGVLSRLKKLKPDVVVLDVRLNNEDGLELLEKLRQKTAIPVVMLSMYEDYEQEALERGACAYLVKGRDIHEFYRTLREAAGQTC